MRWEGDRSGPSNTWQLQNVLFCKELGLGLILFGIPPDRYILSQVMTTFPKPMNAATSTGLFPYRGFRGPTHAETTTQQNSDPASAP